MTVQSRPASTADVAFAPGPLHGAVLAMMSWLSVMASGILSPVLPKIAAYFAGNQHLDLKVGFVATMPALAVALLALPIGHLGDRFGPRRVLLAGLLAYGAAGIAPFWIHSLDAIIVTRFVVGVGEAIAMALSMALIAMSFTGALRQRWLAVQVASANVAGVLTLFAGGFIGRLSWRAPFIAYAFAFVLFVLTWFFVRRPPQAAATVAGNLSLSFAELRAILVKCVLVMVVTFSIAVLVIHMAFLYTERGVRDPGVLGLAIGGSAAGIAVGAAISGLFTRLPPRFVLCLGYGLIAGGFVLVSQPLGVVATALAGLPVGFGCGIATPVLLAATFSNVRDSNMGIVSGLYTASIFIGQFATTPVIVLLKSIAGSLSGAIMVLGLLAGVVSALVLSTIPTAGVP
jgi:MFS family permease